MAETITDFSGGANWSINAAYFTLDPSDDLDTLNGGTYVTVHDFETFSPQTNTKKLGFLTNFYYYTQLQGSGFVDGLINVQNGSIISGTRSAQENMAYLIQSGHFGTSGVIENDYTMKFSTPAFGNGGNMTNHYGIYLEDQQRGDNSYSVYSEGGRAEFAFSVPAMNGSDNYDAFNLEISQGNHTGAGNTVQVLNIEDINFDAQVTASAIKVGTGYTYGLNLPTNIGIHMGSSGTPADITFGGTTLNFSGPPVEFSNQVFAANGSVGAPSYSFSNDTGNDTGLYLPAEDKVGIASGGEIAAQFSYAGGNGSIWAFNGTTGLRLRGSDGVEYSSFNGFGSTWNWGGNIGKTTFQHPVGIGFGMGEPRGVFEIKGSGSQAAGVILADADISQPFTDYSIDPDIFFTIDENSGTDGGVVMRAFVNDDSLPFLIEGYAGTATPSYAPVTINAKKTNGGTGVTDLGGSEKVFEAQNNGNEVFTVDGSGDAFIAGAVQSGNGFSTQGNLFTVDETGVMITTSIEVDQINLNGNPIDLQGADLASANNLTLGSDGDTFEVTGNTTINTISTAGFQNGRSITLVFASNPTIAHNQSPGAGFATILLDGGANIGMTAGDTLTLKLSEQGGTLAWRFISKGTI